jgi:hypothetical protein
MYVLINDIKMVDYGEAKYANAVCGHKRKKVVRIYLWSDQSLLEEEQ